MTPKTVVSADFTEIKALELRCKCGAVLALPIRGTLKQAMICPGCTVELWGTENTADFNLLRELTKILNNLAENKRHFTLGFTTDLPKSE